jgi:hypothetical protein
MKFRRLKRNTFGQDMRAYEARIWRYARAEYFACPPEIRAVIAEHWRQWTGDRGASYFYFLCVRRVIDALPVTCAEAC